MWRSVLGLLLLGTLTGCAGMWNESRFLKVGAQTDEAQATEVKAPSAGEARASLEQATEEVMSLRYARAEALLMPLPKRFVQLGDDVHAAESLFWLGYCAEKLSRTEEAARRYVDVLSRYIHTPSARMARERLEQLSEK